MSYKNLKAEMVKYHVKQADAAEALGMTANNFSMKIREKVPFTVNEVKTLRDKFFPTAQLDYLCESDGDKPRTNRDQCHAYASAIGDILRDADPDNPEIDDIEAMFHKLADLAPDDQEA